ncbi:MULTISPECIES: nitrate reductase cytochrome c-type subunit [unclassified Leisingera]|uniref:nitrate reductase cytochrome c-type subunit n=1 Tax=unclassified Leisingera TaxID=2614906 RepID=UPI0002F588E3|nr:MULTISPECIES: nitrate reductase cytochrome c-type subunit [unclassified Leisingera]KIC18537.1 nitrate reductase [Leisingera sp. ANG-DT]KIC23233.1 nitrate reductase [Leisingera sp. ANG-S3]KIC28939.1 nitrate reductase [Leisingera sp. ANG-M6]KIC32098.1 nitrate reductase [Leisingera sp. ANG-S5]KIC51706.1 nitrate reductase [Leisingera sp. ANG-S]
MKHLRLAILAVPVFLATAAFAQNQVATLRNTAPLDQEGEATQIPGIVNTDIRQVRNYPDQPPLIPHKTDNYQVDLNSNKCLTCHSRTAVEVSQAPMISVTHFMNREGQTLGAVSPRRYFCNQCHVVQTNARPLVENEFVDVDKVIDYVKAQQGGAD